MSNYYAPFNSELWVNDESRTRAKSSRDCTAPPRDEFFRPNVGNDLYNGYLMIPETIHKKGFRDESRVENYNVINFEKDFQNSVSTVDFQNGNATRLKYYTSMTIP